MKAAIPDVPLPEPDPCWLLAPPEGTAAFLPAFARISVAIQAVLRERIPRRHFATAEAFRDLKTAYPLLVYQASRPFRARQGIELTYDVLDPEMLPALLRKARPNLIVLLREVSARLRAAGQTQLAAKYMAGNAQPILDTVEKMNKSRKWLFLLLRGETMLLDALVEFSARQSPAEDVQRRNFARLHKRWGYQLRHMYPREDYSGLSVLLFDAATQALREFRGSQAKRGSIAGAVETPRIVEPETSPL